MSRPARFSGANLRLPGSLSAALSRRLVALGLTLALLLSGCGGGDSEPAERRASAPSPSVTAATEPPPSEAPSPPPAPTPASPAPKPPPAPRPAPPPPPAPAPAAAQPVTGPASPGQYIFDESGSIATAGCLIANQPPPTPTRLNVGGVNGNRQQVDRDQTGSGTVGSVSNAVFEYREDGLYLVSLRQEQRVNAQTLVFDFQANPPARVIPAFPQVGETGAFSLTSADGRVRIDAGTTVEAVGEQVTLGEGASQRAVRLRTDSRISGVSPQGSLNLSVTRTSWYSMDKHLEIKDVTDTTGTVGLCRVNFHVESLARAV